MYSQKKTFDAVVRIFEALYIETTTTDDSEDRTYYRNQINDLIEIADSVLDAEYFEQFMTHVSKHRHAR